MESIGIGIGQPVADRRLRSRYRSRKERLARSLITLPVFTMRLYWLLLSILAVWRITHLFNAEDGPWDVFIRLRKRAGTGFWALLLDCFFCLSLWLALPAALWIGEDWKERLLLWPAVSGGACLLQRFAGSAQPPPAAFYEDDHGMLRKEKK